jgi:hypothetical protein
MDVISFNVSKYICAHDFSVYFRPRLLIGLGYHCVTFAASLICIFKISARLMCDKHVVILLRHYGIAPETCRNPGVDYFWKRDNTIIFSPTEAFIGGVPMSYSNSFLPFFTITIGNEGIDPLDARFWPPMFRAHQKLKNIFTLSQNFMGTGTSNQIHQVKVKAKLSRYCHASVKRRRKEL